jgi:outer membrane receptor protein involved in Fe transport
VEQTARVDARLEIGAVTEAIEIKADVPLINTETFTRGETITPREVQEMPLNGRNFNDLAFLVPGVQPSEQSAKGSEYVTNGVRADGSGVIVDGLNNENPRDAGSQAQPPLDSLLEFKFETSGYSAQYGRLAGGVVNMVLKTGANDLHGALFEYLRNDLFDARNFFDGAHKSELRRNQFGGTLSGPVTIPRLYNGHDRTFFLVAWESFRGVAGNNDIGIVPTAAERQGDFTQDYNATGQLVLIKDPLSSGTCSAATATSAAKTAGCFPGNVIPASRISPVAQALLKYYPLPNYANGGNNFIADFSSPDSWNSFVFKVDQKVAQSDTISVRALTRWENSGNPYAGTSLGTFGSNTKSFQSLYGIAETHVFSPSLINEFHGGLTRTVSDEVALDAGTDWASQLGIPGTTADPNLTGFPKFTITGYETIGDSASDPIRYVVSDWDYNDALTWIKGKHTIKVGLDWLRVQYYQPTNTNFNGSFSISGKATNDGIGDLLLSNVASVTRTVGTVTNHIFESNLGAYVQDDYKILPNLTLNLGLRYEIAFAPYEEYGQLTNFNPTLNKVVIGGVSTLPNWQSIEAGAGLAGYVTLASSVGLPLATVKTNYDNFAPRVGFAWRPFSDNKTVVRSGYGVFYTVPPRALPP